MLSPAGHPAVHQPGIALKYDIGSEPEPLHHAWTEAFDQGVSRIEKLNHLAPGPIVLQINLNPFAAARRNSIQVPGRADAIKSHDFGSHVGQHHASEGTGTNAGEFYDAKSSKGTVDSCGLRGPIVYHVAFLIGQHGDH